MNKGNSIPLEYQTKQNEMNILGFWIFLGAEIILFSTLFVSYSLLEMNTADGPTPMEIFKLGPVLVETLLLLTSSFTSGIAINQMRKNNFKGLIIWLVVTLLLGAGFLSIEIFEFVTYVNEGATLQTSAFLSAFFALLGTHGLHVTFGIGWIIIIMIQLFKNGLTPITARKVFISSLYWHFLDVVWIFILTFVYLKGMVM